MSSLTRLFCLPAYRFFLFRTRDRLAVRPHYILSLPQYLLTCDVIGIRVSLYNAISEEETDKLVSYIDDFLEMEASVAAPEV